MSRTVENTAPTVAELLKHGELSNVIKWCEMSGARYFAREFGKLIKEYCQKKDVSYYQLSLDTGISRENISRTVSARAGKARTQTINKYKRALSIPDNRIDDLIRNAQAIDERKSNDLNIPISFLNAIADQFEEKNSFNNWNEYDIFMRNMSKKYKSFLFELNELPKNDPSVANRIPEIEALIGEGKFTEAEKALEDLRPIAGDRAISALKSLAQVIVLQAESALLRQDVDRAARLFRDAAALFEPLNPIEAASLRRAAWNKLHDGAMMSGGAGLDFALEFAQENLKLHSRSKQPDSWGATQNAIGRTLFAQAIRKTAPESDDLLKQAIKAYRKALSVQTRSHAPIPWAMTMNNLAIALRNQISRSKKAESRKFYDEIIKSFEQALDVYTLERPDLWIQTRDNLSNALTSYGEFAKKFDNELAVGLFRKAIAGYEAALEMSSESEGRVIWGRINHNMSHALNELSEVSSDEDRTAVLQCALNANDNALRARSLEDEPVRWGLTKEYRAQIHFNLAKTRAGSGRVHHLALAKKNITEALEIFDADEHRHSFKKSSELLKDIEEFINKN